MGAGVFRWWSGMSGGCTGGTRQPGRASGTGYTSTLLSSLCAVRQPAADALPHRTFSPVRLPRLKMGSGWEAIMIMAVA